MSGRGRPQKRDAAAMWLKAFLSGGRRSMREIERVGLQQGYSLMTLRRAKASLDFEICSMSSMRGRVWGWRDPSVIEPDAPEEKATLEQKLLHRLDEIERLAQEPKASTASEGQDEGEQPEPIRDIPLDRVDEHGYLVSSPAALGLLDHPATVTASAVLQEINRLTKTSMRHEEIVSRVFEWAYPAAGLAESVLATMLRNNYIGVPDRAPQSKPAHF